MISSPTVRRGTSSEEAKNGTLKYPSRLAALPVRVTGN